MGECCCGIPKKCAVVLGVLVLITIPVIVVVTLKLARKPEVWNGPGSTHDLFSIVLKRCSEYPQQRQRRVQLNLRSEDCPKVQDAFKNAFISKNPCSVTKEDYEPLIRLVEQTIPCNQKLFWSKAKESAHRFTKIHNKVFTLEDTLLGYMADDLTWCGNSSSAELNYEKCPNQKDCKSNSNAVSAFWTAISQKPPVNNATELHCWNTYNWSNCFRESDVLKHICSSALEHISLDQAFLSQFHRGRSFLDQFAESACGVTYVMLNGSLPEPFTRDSTFGSVEVSHLDPGQVQMLKAWVIHGIGKSRDSCSSSSLEELKSIVTARSIKFDCEDITGLPSSLYS